MQNNLLVLFSTLLLIFHPALAFDQKIVDSYVRDHVANLSGKKLKGPVPDLSNLADLQQVYLDDNNFTDVPQGHLSGLTSLTTFSIDNNPTFHDWNVFKELKDSAQLTTFSAISSGLSGQFPNDTSISSFESLENLHLAYNKIEGPLPASLANSGIKSIWLNNQEKPGMSGTIDVIAAMLSVKQVWLHVNQFSGWIPDLSNCTQLDDLWLRDNQFSGPIPPTLGNLSALENLTLKGNNLSGPIPRSLTNLPNLKNLDFYGNNLSGKVPAFRQNVVVNTSDNRFIGTDLPIDLHPPPPPGSGKTPSSGAINPPPASGITPSGTSGMSPWAVAVIVVVVIIIAAVVGFCACKRCSKKKRFDSAAYKRPNQLSDSEVYTTGISQQLSSQVSINISDGGIQMDLLIEVTDNFSEANVIGRGGFGTVYRAKLPDGTEVAVKRMVAPVLMSSKGMNEYKAEIEVLSKVKHRNLVGLIGFCANGNERLLVYEFMPQGTLGDHLFDWRRRGGRPLTWSQRAAIALDVARGVDYLHTMTEQSFIHRDLKPNNILLGNDMRAKVADFGLVKNATNVAESIQTKVAGTFGYFAPEYWETGRVTTKADVYAFGVILMEMISGRKVVDDSPDAIDGGNLMLRFRRILAGKEDVRDHIDPSLQADDDEETYNSICKVVELAGHCTVSEPQRRCDMRYAVFVLTSLVEQWTPSNSDVSTSFGIGHNMQLPSLVEEWKAGNGMPSTSYTYT